MNAIQKAQKIKLLAMDVDGILSNGQITYDANGIESKSFYVQDGVGLKALRDFGITLAIITGRSSPMVEKRAKELGITHLIQGQDDKFTQLSSLAVSLGLELSECAYMGDDLPDLMAIKYAGLGISVPNGCTEVQEIADMTTTKLGGYGAVREVCEFILKAQGHYDDFVDGFRS